MRPLAFRDSTGPARPTPAALSALGGALVLHLLKRILDRLCLLAGRRAGLTCSSRFWLRSLPAPPKKVVRRSPWETDFPKAPARTPSTNAAASTKPSTPVTIHAAWGAARGRRTRRRGPFLPRSTLGQLLRRPATSPSVRSAARASAAAVSWPTLAEETRERERRVVACGKRALQGASERVEVVGVS